MKFLTNRFIGNFCLFIFFNFFMWITHRKRILCALESMLPEDFDSTDSVVSDYI